MTEEKKKKDTKKTKQKEGRGDQGERLEVNLKIQKKRPQRFHRETHRNLLSPRRPLRWIHLDTPGYTWGSR